MRFRYVLCLLFLCGPAAAQESISVSTAPFVQPLKELLAQLSPRERSRFFEGHPGLKVAVGWKEAPPIPSLTTAGIESRSELERERREMEYHIRPAESAAAGAATPLGAGEEASASNPEPDSSQVERESASQAQKLIDRMDADPPEMGDY
jgi:hypothetical protein